MAIKVWRVHVNRGNTSRFTYDVMAEDAFEAAAKVQALHKASSVSSQQVWSLGVEKVAEITA